MSAETLRRAASLMRERAEAATNTAPLPWFAVSGAVYAGTAAPHQVIAPCLTYYDDAAHIASWHPAVALAVADMLDEAANGVEVMAPLDWDYPMGPMDCTGSLRPEFAHALTVGRAYLGDSGGAS